MMTRSVSVLALAGALILVAGSAPVAQSGHDKFQQALAKERAEGKLSEAVQLYQAVVDAAEADRSLKARALVRMAGCYRNLGITDAASRTYDRVLREFADQVGPVADARAGVTALAATGTSRVAKPVLAAEPAPRRVDYPPFSVPSPDGQYLAIWSDNDLVVRHVATGAVKKLTAHTDKESACEFAWSRDSRQLAYEWCHETGPGQKDLHELRVIGVDGTGQRVLRSKTEDDIVPRDWSADGRTIAVAVRKASDDTLHLGVVSAADGTLRLLKNFGTATTQLREVVSFTQDGQYLVYSGRRHRRILESATSSRFPRPMATSRCWSRTRPTISFLDGLRVAGACCLRALGLERWTSGSSTSRMAGSTGCQCG